MSKIIVTGSEGVIGKSICSYLSRPKPNFESVPINEIIKFDLVLGHNLNDENVVKKLFSENKADYLINLFAINDHIDPDRKTDKQDLFNVSLNSLRDYFQTNLISLFSVCREFARNNDSGGIINFSSIYGVVSPQPDMYNENKKHIGYCISKGGVIQMTKYLAVHLAPNFNVNCIVPGGIVYKQDYNFVKKYSDKTPLRRMMNVEELNGIVELLCSKQSSYMTGSIITVDGGWIAQ